MLSEREKRILDDLEHDLNRTGRRHRLRAPSLVAGVILILVGELIATPWGIVLALIGFVVMVSASAVYVIAARSRPRRSTLRSRVARVLPLLRRW